VSADALFRSLASHERSLVNALEAVDSVRSKIRETNNQTEQVILVMRERAREMSEEIAKLRTQLTNLRSLAIARGATTQEVEALEGDK
jgi:predicted  nucleic acid-binding Zn-ribbon protein